MMDQGKSKDDFLWWRDGVIYQIYPRSFMDLDQDGLGDLNGIISKLDYLHWLGVDGIWLSPIFPSPDVDFGYDVSDYYSIHPRYGSLEDFDRLVAEAHRHGIRVILDMVLNHTSDQHPWFQQALQSKDNPYHDWYIWREQRGQGKAPNNWASMFGGSGWKYIPHLEQSYFHFFYEQQPDLNWRNADVQREAEKIFRFWMDRGVDGFRLDVINACYKDANFRDNPPKLGLRKFDRQQHLYDMDQPEMVSFLEEIRRWLDHFPERYAVGEPFLPTPEKAAFYCQPNRLHAAFNFELLGKPWDARQFSKAIQTWDHILDPRSWPCQVLNNHDNPRSATRFGRGEDDARLTAAAVILLTLRGTPYLYYGEEIGMRDIRVARRNIQDPVGRRYWPFYKGRDGCRSPMQWDASRHAGFSQAAKTWLPVHSNHSWRNVAAQRENPASLLHTYRRLIALRKNSTALQKGLLMPLTYDPVRLLAYLRQTGDETALIAVNFSRRPVKLMLSAELTRRNIRVVYSNRREDGLVKIEKSALRLLGGEALIAFLDS